MKIHIPSPLRSYTKQDAVISASGANLGQVLHDIDRQFPGFRFRIIDEQDDIREHIKIFVNESQVRDLSTSTSDRDTVHIICALSGGMMSELELIADQIKRSYEGEAWHGPSVKEALDGVTPEQAAHKSIPDAHTIWELVLHIAAWADIVRRRISGEIVDVTPAMNFPEISNQSAAAWQSALSTLERSQKAIIEFTPTISPSRLHEPVMKGGSTVYVQLHGVAQHNVYHAGQIMILRKCH